MEQIILWFEKNQQPCFYKKHLGVNCPGCGMQRAFIELLKGNLYESILIYPALMPMIIMLLYLSAHILFKFKNGSKVLMILFIFTFSLIIINFVIKII